MSIKYYDIEKEDIILFIGACFACSGQKEFYSSKAEQRVSIRFLHYYVMSNYRELYASCLALGINHYNKTLIIGNLLRTGAETPKEFAQIEGSLIRYSLRTLPPPRVYRLFKQLRKQRVNNRRSRAVVRDYLGWHRDLAFQAVKYSTKIRSAAQHAHLSLPDEVGDFLFQGAQSRHWETELFETYRQSHFSQAALYKLPYTIAEGLAIQRGINRKKFLQKILPSLTQKERLRLEKTLQREKVKTEKLDLKTLSLDRLTQFWLSYSIMERREKLEEFSAAFSDVVQSLLGNRAGQMTRVAAILDRSWSTKGSIEKRSRSLGVALGISQILRQYSQEYLSLWTVPLEEELLCTPKGQTDIASPLLRALRWKPDLIIIISDGYENAPSSAADEIARIYHQKVDKKPQILHFNPVFNPEDYAPKRLGEHIWTLGIRDAQDIIILLNLFSQVLREGSFDSLQKMLSQKAENFVHIGKQREEREEL